MLVATLFGCVSAAGGQTVRPASQASGNGSASLPTDLASYMDARDYTKALALATRELAQARGQADLHALRMTIFECHLQLKHRDEAIKLLRSIEENTKDASADDKTEATALRVLLMQSPNLKYIPQTSSSRAPLDLLDPTQRTAAMKALLADKIAALDAPQNISARGTDPHIAALKSLDAGVDNFTETRTIERAATHSVSQTQQFAGKRSQDAQEQIEKELKNFSDRINQIAENASRLANPNITGPRARAASPRRGLTEEETAEMAIVVTFCNAVPNLTKRMSDAFDDPEVLELDAMTANIKSRVELLERGNYIAARGNVAGRRGNGAGRRRGARN